MEDNNQIIIDIGLDAMIASLRELKKQYEANTAAMKALRKNNKQDSDEYIQLTQANKVLRQEMNGVERSIQNNIKAEKAQEGSLVQLRAQLANLNKQYDSMSGFERMGTAGEALRGKIKALSDNISSLEANTGRYQRNVGNYKSALEGLRDGFKGAGLATGGLDKSLKLLNANPIMLLLTAIVAVVRNIIKSFKDNEEATMALKEAFSAFNPIIDAAKRGLEVFAKMIVNVVTTAVDGLTAAVGWLLDKAQAVGNFFGADWHMGDNFKAGVAAAKELQAAENELIKAKREWGKESAKIDQQVADAREKAADKERYTAKERVKFLDEAIALETKKAQKEKEFAEWELRNLQAEAKRSANSAAMNDKLAQAEIAVTQAETNLANVKRTLNKERQRAVNETNRSTQAVKGHAAAVKEDTDAVVRAAEEYSKKTAEEMRKAEDAINDIIKDGFAKREAVEMTAYERSRARLTAAMEDEKAAHGEDTAMYRAYYMQLEALEEKHQDTMEAIKADRQKADADAMAEDERLRWENRILIAKQIGEDYNTLILQQLEATMMGLTQAADESDEAFYNRRLEAQAAYLSKRKEMSEAEVAMERAKANAIADFAGSISKAIEQTAGDNEAAVRAAKVVALAEVAIKQGVAIAEAVASAAAGDPYTYAFRVAAAIASTVAAMAQAISAINSSGFATGGVVGGFSGATMGGDNTYIKARNGEMVLNAEQQRQLFEVANGATSPSVMAQLVEALHNMPAPVMDYQEFTRFQSRVATYSETSKLK